MISQDDIDTFEFYNRQDLTLTEYQNAAATTAIYPASVQILYPTLGLAGEAGEVANKVKKIYRDHDGVLTDEYKQILSDELGDCLWYVAAIASELGVTLGKVAMDNVNKLADRKIRNQLGGDGDNR